MRVATILALLLLTGLLPPPAEARGTDAKEVGKTLVRRGYDLLRRAEMHFAQNRTAEAAKHAREAERIFRSVLNQEPRNLQAALLGGQAATLAGDMKNAAAWIERYAKLSPGGRNDPDYHFLVAFVQLLGDKRPDRALRSLTRMYSTNPRARPVERDNLWFRALSDHGTNLLRSSKHIEAIVQFRLGARIARRLGNRRYELMMLANIGAALVQSDRYIEATEVYSGLVKAEKTNPLWRYRLAICHANQSRFAQAVPVYREVLALMAKGHTARGWEAELRQVNLRLGNCLRHLAEQQPDKKQIPRLYADAETHIRAYIKLAPEDSVGHKWLGVLLYENLNKPYEAMPHLQKAFELDEICEDTLRFMLQIRRTFPPPKGTSEKDWRAPLEGLMKNLADGVERRKAERKKRLARHGGDHCG